MEEFPKYVTDWITENNGRLLSPEEVWPYASRNPWPGEKQANYHLFAFFKYLGNVTQHKFAVTPEGNLWRLSVNAPSK